MASTHDRSGSQLQLAFQPHEAYWLVFDSEQPARFEPVMALPKEEVVLAINGTWNVRVDTAAQPTLEHAVKIPDSLTGSVGVVHDLTLWETWAELPTSFSGLVDYTKTVTLPKFEGDLILDLGTVKHFAEVWVNGKHLGAKLWPPHKFQTDAFRPGSNEIRIRVGNLVNNNYNMASPSGLLGPVIVKTTMGSMKMNNAAVPCDPGGFRYFVGIVGNPSVPDITWSDEQLEQIKALGVNMVQLSIAFGWKPANEVLNLEDLDAEQRAKFAFRIKQAQKHGLKTLAHFGIPRMIEFGQPACILDPAVRKKYTELLTDFMTSFPEVDDVLVYTFDQGAWLCSEFGPCPRCSGVPLDERVPDFLNLLNETMQKCRPNTRLRWKPWELSKGQVVAILDKVKPGHFGVVLNPSASNEVYPFNDRSFKSDLGVKRLVQMAKERGIPALGEFEQTLYKPLYMMEDFFPRLIHEQMAGWKEMEGVVGVKEYYGFAPSTFSVNAAMLKAWMKAPNAPLETLLQEIAAPYGPKAALIVIQAWEYVAQSVEAYPWDVTYLIGPLGLDRHWDGSHGWEPVDIPNATWDTPIWKANRRASFMLTEEDKAHPWLFEDAGLRLEDSAALGFKAVGFYDQAIAAGGSKADDIRTQREIVWKTARSLRAKSLHFLETLAAQDARMAQNDEKQLAIVTKRLEALLKKDVENQGGNAAVTQKFAEFQRDPKAWVDANLNSRDYKAKATPDYETRATIDWSKWAPRED